MELEASWGRALRVWWAFFWRNLIAIVVAGLIGAAGGFAIGFVMGMAGVESEIIKYFSSAFGLVIGVAISVVPVKLILNKNYGGFRLSIIPVAAAAE
ncbi:hypothetical protein NBZ79_15550 [Sneathiella marina]|uniref:Uncharacterized protein n=1 Tax=Sneathiella marina TaxID=2950108 RepID=A0ABY4W7F3_9PROT|nr:hypothetical protein [Sneathiella marina]USG60581.1 hypothetical protein NBZ79_15550 [Sneathiella marina]